MLRDAALLDVDGQQRFLAAVTRDDGTLVQELSTGTTWPIAPKAESGSFTREGNLLVLQGPVTNDVRALWVWQPGQAQAHEVGHHWASAVVNEGTRRYLAFTEKTPDDAVALRMVPFETCTAEACPVRTLFRIENDAYYPVATLHAGDRFIWLTKKERVWRVDLESGEVKPIEHSATWLRFSPSRTRFAELTPGQHIRMYDSATEALLWETTAEASTWGFTFSFFDEDSVILNVNQTEEFGAFPEDRKSFHCSAQGCVQVADAQCEPRPGNPPRLLSCFRRNSPTVNYSHDSILMRTPGVVLSQRGDVFSDSYVSEDTETVVWLTGKPSEPGLKLEWEGVQPSQPLVLPEPYYLRGGVFVEDPRRFVFSVDKTLPDGGKERVLSTWDGQTAQELYRIDGIPGPFLMRTQPSTLYTTVREFGGDVVTNPSAIQRFSF
ncbi:hypothetical protein D7V88_25235 [Corallococcus terminator]|uniref:WD40 repeat domain-containing protein n=1 Tax=Corallococcus terminator TaxID=2316733 RepID=A0A3A8IVV7_9BACT|nr:hypothetical protein D7V88_25235 [Corallococcus terminator]